MISSMKASCVIKNFCTLNQRMKRYKKDKSLQGIEDLSSMAPGNEMIKVVQN